MPKFRAAPHIELDCTDCGAAALASCKRTNWRGKPKPCAERTGDDPIYEGHEQTVRLLRIAKGHCPDCDDPIHSDLGGLLSHDACSVGGPDA